MSSYPQLTQEQISRAIGLSRIVLIVGLVFLHYGSFPNSLASPFQGIDIGEHQFATWLNSAILFFFFSTVPLLSMISGWLFFSFRDEDAHAALKKRIKRRFFSLYLVLVVWNLGYLAALYTLFHFNPHASPFTHANRLNMDFAAAGPLQYINAVFGISDEPIGFQFWFVRDLFVTAVVSPIMWLMLKRAPWAGAAILCLIWLSGWNLFIFIRTDVPFFFYMGALVRRQNLRMTIPLPTVLTLIALYLTLVSLRALAPCVAPSVLQGVDPLWLAVATRLMRVVGVLACWGTIYRVAQTPAGQFIGSYGGLAFFLHSAHWPLLAIVKVGVWRFMPGDSDGFMLLHYLISVALTVTIGLTAGMMLARFAPRVFSLMNGGRMLGQAASTPILTQGAVPAYAD